MTTIRPSRDADIDAIAAIYRQHVLEGTATFELIAPEPAEMAARRDSVLASRLPWLVAEDNGEVVGYSYCHAFHLRPAYRFTAEDSIYLAPSAQRRGVGRMLLAALLAQTEAAGIRRVIALIGDSANVASIGLHRALGFEPVGVLKSCGWKFGRWLDVVLMEKALGAGDATAPE